ncbi:holocarboxylase synthetase [Fagus crenata]
MAKKRKSVATSLDEVDRTMYTSFSSAANSLSQLYTQAMNHQKYSFQAGERQGLEKLYQWIRRQQEEGSRVTTVDILNYIQNELDYCGEEPSMSPRAPVQHQHSQPVTNFMNSGFPVSTGSSCPTTAGQGIRSEHCDHQSKNSVFSNALSSPVRQSLQHYHITRGGYCPNSGLPLGNGARNSELTFLHNQSRDSTAPSSNDSAMDMHADSPAQEFIY